MKVGCVQLQARNLPEYPEAAQDVYAAIRQYGLSHDLLVFPECAYPGYFLYPESLREEALLGAPAFVAEVARLALVYDTYVAVGVAECGLDGELRNNLVFIDRKGTILARAPKQHLWHFDTEWFREGDNTVVVDTEYGPMGLVVCADARLPEIIRDATLKGARLIIDCANLTAQGRELSEVSNAQVDYLLAVRAFENGVWLIMADKWGIEGNFATYAGHSSIYTPQGNAVVAAPAVGNVVISYEIPLIRGMIDEAPRDAAMARRTLLDTSELHNPRPDVIGKLDDPVRIGAMVPFVSVVAGTSSVDPDAYVRLMQRLWHTETDLICWPPMSERHFSTLTKLEKIPEQVVSLATVRTARGLDVYYQEGGATWELMTTRASILHMHWGSLGIIRDEDIQIPEIARQLMLHGVDMIYWPHIARTSLDLDLARSRALENRVFVCAVSDSPENVMAASYIIDPSGGIAARTLLGESLHVAQMLVPCALARIKEVVPGTNVLSGRRPGRYTTL